MSTQLQIVARSARRTSSRRVARLLTMVALCVWVAGAQRTQAEDTKLPKGEDILARFVKVTGGEAAYKKVRNSVTKGTLGIPAMGLTGTIVVYAAAPNKQYTSWETESFGKIEQGTNGETIWESSAMSGPRIKEGSELVFAKRAAMFNGELRWREVYSKAECVAEETVGEEPCYKVIMTAKEGNPETRYYSKQSGLLIKAEMKIVTQMGEMGLTVVAGDYRKEGDLLVAHKSTQSVMGRELVTTTESIEYNAKIDPNRFRLPDTIKELLEEATVEEVKVKPS